jgi:lysophospholipase-3
VTTPKRKYTVFDYEELFNDISFPQGYELFKKSNHLLNNLNAPNVEIHSLYGVGVKTPENFEYDELENWYDKQPFINFGDGDGTVNKKSLIGFERWILKQNEKIYSRELQGVDHLQILKNKYTTEYILDLLYL